MCWHKEFGTLTASSFIWAPGDSFFFFWVGALLPLEELIVKLSVGESWRKERPPTPIFWPGEFHGLYSAWCHKEWDTTKLLYLPACLPGDLSVKNPAAMQGT